MVCIIRDPARHDEPEAVEVRGDVEREPVHRHRHVIGPDAVQPPRLVIRVQRSQLVFYREFVGESKARGR